MNWHKLSFQKGGAGHSTPSKFCIYVGLLPSLFLGLFLTFSRMMSSLSALRGKADRLDTDVVVPMLEAGTLGLLN